MSSFLCFVCNSTVNADTNEETREQYREVIGMHLCPDSHLCYICCYFLNKMCLFKSICLKRSLEYPVLFSERGTINLQRGETQVAIMCPEDTCLQHLNTRYHFYNNSENSQSDYDDNSYCQLQDENVKNTDFHCELDESLKTNEFNKDYVFKHDYEDDCQRNYTLEIDTKETSIHNNYAFHKSSDSQIKEEDEDDQIEDEESIVEEPMEGIHDKDPIKLESTKVEAEFDVPLSEDVTNKDSDNEREETTQYGSTVESDTNSQEPTEEEIAKKEKRKKEFTLIMLTEKEQKKELEDARKEEKYATASHKCFSCAISFHFKDTYQAHMMRHEESNGEFSCPICSLRFANPAVLRSHTRNHSERYKCSRCKEIVRARQRITHKRACSGAQVDKTVQCHLCNAGFITLGHLQQHIKRYHQAKTSTRTYLCNICGKSYNNQAAVRTHMITHINRKFTCDQCNAIFSSPYTLNQHKKKHTITEPEIHFCAACKIGYNTKKSLLAHMRNALAHKDSVYKCPLCSRVCPTVKALQSHTDAVHARTNHLACDACPAKYSTRKALIRHMKRHNGEIKKPTTLCHSCGVNFKSSRILKKHLKNVCEKDKTEELYYV